MKLFIQREVLSRFESKFTNEETQVEELTKKVQFMERLENGKVVLSEIKLLPTQDIKDLVPETKIQMEVRYSTFKNKTYLRQVGELQIKSK